MNSKVKVEANKQGDLISRSPNSPQWGWIRVTQMRNVLQEETGIIRPVFCSALVQGKISDLKRLGWKDGMELDGKIIFKDSLTPFRKVNSDKDFKVAGNSGIVCSLEGQAIYRKYLYSANPAAQDVVIEHDAACRLQIRQAYLELEGLSTVLKQNVEADPELEFSL